MTVAAVRRFTAFVLLIAAPVLLVAGYLAAQQLLQQRAARFKVESVSANDALRQALDRGDSNISRLLEDTQRILAEYSFIFLNIAPTVLPLVCGAAWGVWVALVVETFLARRTNSLRGLPNSAVISGRPTKRVCCFARDHLIGLVLCALGLSGGAFVCAGVNAWWYRPGRLMPREFARDSGVPLADAVITAAPAALVAGALVLGVHLIFRRARTSPFLLLSRARAVTLAVAALGAACIIFSQASIGLFDARWRGLRALVSISDPAEREFFAGAIGHAGLTDLGTPLGVALMLVGLAGWVLVPRHLSRRPGFLAGATECVNCAHPLRGAQAVCSECGRDHGGSAKSA